MVNNLQRNLGKPILNKDVGIRLDRYLANNFLFCTRPQWKNKIMTGLVCVNSITVKKSSYCLQRGDQVTYYYPREVEPSVNKEIKVLWEKGGIIAVYKPSDLPMHEAGVYRLNTFCNVLSELLGEQWAPIHRLDRETSGIVLCADKRVSREAMSKLFRLRDINKTYLAIVNGKPKKDLFEVNQPISSVKSQKIRSKLWVHPSGMKSLTSFEVVETRGDKTLLKVFPKTGRTHQIRIHSAYLGHPLVGDSRYHADESIYLEHIEQGLTDRVKAAIVGERLCLHATKISFLHPVCKTICDVTAKMPKEMQAIWDRFL